MDGSTGRVDQTTRRSSVPLPPIIVNRIIHVKQNRTDLFPPVAGRHAASEAEHEGEGEEVEGWDGEG